MTRFRTLACLTLAAAFAGCADRLSRGDRDDVDERGEEAVAVEQLPPAVRDTLMRESAGGKVVEVDRHPLADGKWAYEADVLAGGKKWEVAIADDGTLSSKKVDDEKDREDEEDD